jgi:hypothetical protein
MQGALFPADGIPMLKKELLGKMSGRTLAFDELVDECCDDNELRQPDYRKALQELRREDRIEVSPITSKTQRGLRGEDAITFP